MIYIQMPANRFGLDPSLTGNLNAEYEALQNDLEQAKLLAADYQNQLSDKSNDVAALKSTLEKTAADLERLQANIVALREERHRLANEVMKVVSLEAKLAAANTELDRLRADAGRVASLEANLAAAKVELKRLRNAGAGSAGNAKPDMIDFGFDDDKDIEIVPTPIEPRPGRAY